MCENTDHGCEQVCEVIEGGYECLCETGYRQSSTNISACDGNAYSVFTSFKHVVRICDLASSVLFVVGRLEVK